MAATRTGAESPDLDSKVEHAEHVEHYATVTKSAQDVLTIRQALVVYKRAAFFATIAAFSAMCDGYQVNLNGSIIANKGFIRQFGTVRSATGVLSLDPKHVSVWGGIQSVGQVVGMTSLSFVSDRFGRKKTLGVIWFIMAMSVLAETLATNFAHWTVAKILAGIGVGGMQGGLPMYISEIAPVQLRGALINAYSLWFVFGQFLAPLILQTHNRKDPLNFRLPIYTQWVFIGALAVFWAVLPESPWWLAAKENEAHGKKNLRRINGDVPGYDVDAEWNIMRATIEHERLEAERTRSSGSFIEIFKGTNGWRTLIACWSKCCQQLTGLTLVNSYSSYFFQLAGNKDPFRVTLILACVQMASILLVSLYTDVGRRWPTVIGYGIASLSVLSIGIIGTQDYTSPSLGSLLIFFACSTIFFNTASGAIGYVYLAEIPTQKWRARTAGFGAAMGACFGVCFSFSVPIMLRGAPKWGVKTGFFFGITGSIATIIAYFILPETAQRTTAEIDELFEKKVSPRKFKGFKTDVQLAAEAEQRRAEF